MSFDIAKYPTLALVNSTQELRLLPKESLPKLCDELRRYLLDSVSRSSMRLGLGTVRLTVALHYVYNTPFDQLIWDVGHQAYPHKILTGRRDKIGTIRQKGGLHPFPWRGESQYDVLSIGIHQPPSVPELVLRLLPRKKAKIAAPSVSLAMARLPLAWRLKR